MNTSEANVNVQSILPVRYQYMYFDLCHFGLRVRKLDKFENQVYILRKSCSLRALLPVQGNDAALADVVLDCMYTQVQAIKTVMD